MKILILSDVHGNFHALDAVMKHEAYDAIACCGDLVVGYPFPGQCIRALRSAGAHVCRGNNDELAVSGRGAAGSPTGRYARFASDVDRAAALTRLALGDTERRYLAGLPDECRFTVDGVSFYMNHTAPGLPATHYLDRELPAAELDRYFAGIRADVIVTGHTHLPYTHRINGRIFVNPGSVGEPRDGDRRASYATFDTTTGRIVTGRRIYDITETARQLNTLNYPSYSLYCLEHGHLPENPDAAAPQFPEPSTAGGPLPDAGTVSR